MSDQEMSDPDFNRNVEQFQKIIQKERDSHATNSITLTDSEMNIVKGLLVDAMWVRQKDPWAYTTLLDIELQLGKKAGK